jgi:hypothetical protein
MVGHHLVPGKHPLVSRVSSRFESYRLRLTRVRPVADGALHMMTPVDPLLLALPQFPASPDKVPARTQSTDMLRKFRLGV